MRPMETLLSLANLATFFALAMPSLRAMRLMRYSALAAFVIVGVQALVEGARWQMIPAYALAGLFFLAWLLPYMAPVGLFSAQRWFNRLAAGLPVGLGVLGTVVSIGLPIIVPVFHFPQPTGPYAIGCVGYLVICPEVPRFLG